MRIIIAVFSLLLLLLPSHPLNAQVQSDTTCEKALGDIIEKWKDGYNNGQASRVASLYTEDAYYLAQHFITGIIHGHAAIQAYVQRGIDAHYHVDSIRIVLLKRSGDFAYAITRYYSTNGDRGDTGVNLVVLRKTADRWFIAAHEAAVPDTATAVKQLDMPSQH